MTTGLDTKELGQTKVRFTVSHKDVLNGTFRRRPEPTIEAVARAVRSLMGPMSYIDYEIPKEGVSEHV